MFYRTTFRCLLGYAYTFITEDQAQYAGDIIKALELSGTAVPPDLEKLWSDFKDQQKAVSFFFYITLLFLYNSLYSKP